MYVGIYESQINYFSNGNFPQDTFNDTHGDQNEPTLQFDPSHSLGHHIKLDFIMRGVASLKWAVLPECKKVFRNCVLHRRLTKNARVKTRDVFISRFHEGSMFPKHSERFRKIPIISESFG